MPDFTFDTDKIYISGARTNKFAALTRPDDVTTASALCGIHAVPRPGVVPPAPPNALLSINSVGISTVHNPSFGFFGGSDITISSVVLHLDNTTGESVTLSFFQSDMSDSFNITNSGNWISAQTWTVPDNTQATLEILATSTSVTLPYSSSLQRHITAELDVVGDDTNTVYVDGDAGGHVHVRYIINSLGFGQFGIASTEFRDSDGNIT